MKKILVMVLLLFFVAGCVPGQQDDEEVFSRGVEGLSMRFLDGMPASSLFAGSDFNIGVDLRNEGFADIEKGYLSPKGFSENYIKLDRAYYELPVLEGRSFTNPDGGRGSVIFNGQITDLKDIVSDYVEQPVIITGCYIYRTLAGPNVCLSSNLYNTEEDACQVGDVLLESQGSPVVVSEVKEEMVLKDDKVEFYFTIFFKHLGDGNVIKQELVNDKCAAIGAEENIPAYQQLNRIYIESITLNGNDYERLDPLVSISGTPFANAVLLNRDGEGIANVKFVFSRDSLKSPFKSPLNIVMKYGYREHITKNVLIKKRIGVIG